MKDGFKTTEFWLAMLTNAFAMFGGMLSPDTAAMTIGVVNGTYAIARSLAKGGVIKGTVGPELAGSRERLL